MSPLSTGTPQDRRSPRTLSGTESESSLEVEDAGRSEGGMKRRLKSRDAARKSRKKQTEIADDLHEEMQHLERSNSTLLKEIELLRKDVKVYETLLKNHEPFCRLGESGSADLHWGEPAPTCSGHQTPKSSAPPPPIPITSLQDAPSVVRENNSLPLDLIDIASGPLLDFLDCFPPTLDCGIPFSDTREILYTDLSGPLPPAESNNPSFSFQSTLFSAQALTSNPILPLPTHSCTQQSCSIQCQPLTYPPSFFPFDQHPSSECPSTKTPIFSPQSSIPALSQHLHDRPCFSPQLSSSEAPPQSLLEAPLSHISTDLGHTSGHLK